MQPSLMPEAGEDVEVQPAEGDPSPATIETQDTEPVQSDPQVTGEETAPAEDSQPGSTLMPAADPEAEQETPAEDDGELTVDEDFTRINHLDETGAQEYLQGLQGFGEEHGLSPAQLKAVAARDAEYARQQEQAWQDVTTGYANETRADPEIGGAKLAETIRHYHAGLAAIASPALSQLLRETGFGDHPEVVRSFAAAGRKLASESPGTVPGTPVASDSDPWAGRYDT